MGILMDELEQIGSEVDRLIMSEGLDVDLGDAVSADQFLMVNEMKYICAVLRASYDGTRTNIWEYELEVPGISLKD